MNIAKAGRAGVSALCAAAFSTSIGWAGSGAAQAAQVAQPSNAAASVTHFASGLQYPPGLRFGPDGYLSYLRIGATRNLNERYLHDSVKTWNDLSQHWQWDGFWKERSIRRRRLKPSPFKMR